MKKNIFQINPNARTAKYVQLVRQIESGVLNGTIQEGAWLPSISEVSFENNISRDTVEKAYAILKSKGIIISVPNIGHFIQKKSPTSGKLRILLVFHKMSEFKKVIFNSFLSALSDMAEVVVQVHENNPYVFEQIIQASEHKFDYYVISNFNDNQVLFECIPKSKLVILDKQLSGWDPKTYACVYQDFVNDLYSTLKGCSEIFARYDKIVLIFPENHLHEPEVISALSALSNEIAITFDVYRKINPNVIRPRTVFLVISDPDLTKIIQYCFNEGLSIGNDVGIIAYNESPLKAVAGGGITVVSTDFESMGRLAASLCLEFKFEQIHVPFKMIRRASF